MIEGVLVELVRKPDKVRTDRLTLGLVGDGPVRNLDPIPRIGIAFGSPASVDVARIGNARCSAFRRWLPFTLTAS
jgi:hypothetical protein